MESNASDEQMDEELLMALALFREEYQVAGGAPALTCLRGNRHQAQASVSDAIHQAAHVN